MKVPRKKTARAFWLMLMKPPAPASRLLNRLTLTLPPPVDLRKTEECLVEAPTVVEVELVRLVDNRLRVVRRAEREPAGRNPADSPGFHGEGDEIEDVLLVGDVGHPLGHPDAEVDHRVELQEHCRPPGDHLPLVERHRNQQVGRGTTSP